MSKPFPELLIAAGRQLLGLCTSGASGEQGKGLPMEKSLPTTRGIPCRDPSAMVRAVGCHIVLCPCCVLPAFLAPTPFPFLET